MQELGSRRIVCADFEFHAKRGERPTPLCLAAADLDGSRCGKVWLPSAVAQELLPSTHGDTLVAYYAPAEMACMLEMGLPLPSRVIDLYAEFRNATNGIHVPGGNGLANALFWLGLSPIDCAHKEAMRDLAMRGGPYSESEQQKLLAYCKTDVDVLPSLLRALLPQVNLDQAMLRGEFAKAVAVMEHNGIPVDVESVELLNQLGSEIREGLIADVDADFGVYEVGSFSEARFGDYLHRNHIAWPTHPNSNRLVLDQETFSDMSKVHPPVRPLHELRKTCAQLQSGDLPVGSDGRNRAMLSMFRSRSGRNQPSTTDFIFNRASWMRALIRPEPGQALAYIDYSQQEFAIAASLSGDMRMMQAYQSGDPYLAFAKQAGAVPEHATKASHKQEREQFKICALAVQYGMGPRSLAVRLNRSQAHARQLLRLHRSTYPRFWAWSQASIDHAVLRRRTNTVFGWNLHTGLDPNPRFLANFPCQGNGAEMLRLACCLILRRDVKLLAPIHDAVLIEAAEAEIDHAVWHTREAMREASEHVLDGFEVQTDVEIVRYPERLGGGRMWELVKEKLSEKGRCNGYF